MSLVDPQYFEISETRTRCPHKGEAGYYSLVVDGARNSDAVCFYAAPDDDALSGIAGRVAFLKDVQIVS